MWQTPISRKNQQKYPQKIKSQSQVKSKFVDECYEVGGANFVEWLRKNGVNEQGEKLKLRAWHLEYAELIADMRVAATFTSGASQLGKTLIHTLFLCYCLKEGRINALWSYDLRESRDIQVPSNFRPIAEKIAPKSKNSNDTRNTGLYQINGATAQFVYVSTSKRKTNDDGTAAAGGTVVGVSRDILFREERSQYPPGAGDPLTSRLKAGRLPSRPERDIGTPGSGRGIEEEIEKAEYHFYPHYTCPSCGVSAPLHPKGCLLKKVDGKYLSPSGRPIDWFQKDGEAYFGCSECGSEILDKIREQAYFKCLKTGITLRDFLSKIPKGIPRKRVSVGVSLSPLLRIQQTNLAQEMIVEGLSKENSEDWQQQTLGLASESSDNNVTLDMLKAAIGAEPDIYERESLSLCGGDQGRSEYWLWKCKYYLPVDWCNMPLAQVIDKTLRVVTYAGDIIKDELPDRIADCAFGIIDSEPDIAAAAQLCGATCLEMADQQAFMLDAVKMGIANEGGIEHSCWKIRNNKFLKQVLDNFAMGNFYLPAEWNQWVGKPTERSPLVHLTAPSYDPASGRWKRGRGNVDDLYYAAMFAEAALYIYLLYRKVDTDLGYGGNRDIYNILAGY